jgi:hypothetical protein
MMENVRKVRSYKGILFKNSNCKDYLPEKRKPLQLERLELIRPKPNQKLGVEGIVAFVNSKPY